MHRGLVKNKEISQTLPHNAIHLIRGKKISTIRINDTKMTVRTSSSRHLLGPSFTEISV